MHHKFCYRYWRLSRAKREEITLTGITVKVLFYPTSSLSSQDDAEYKKYFLLFIKRRIEGAF